MPISSTCAISSLLRTNLSVKSVALASCRKTAKNSKKYPWSRWCPLPFSSIQIFGPLAQTLILLYHGPLLGKTMPCLPPLTGNGLGHYHLSKWWWLGGVKHGIALPTLAPQKPLNCLHHGGEIISVQLFHSSFRDLPSNTWRVRNVRKTCMVTLGKTWL